MDIPQRINDTFIQITTDLSGVILEINAGNFASPQFMLKNSIYDTCPFLENTFQALPFKEWFLLEGMVLNSYNEDYNIDIELFKEVDKVLIVVLNRTHIYKNIIKLNQNRNDLYLKEREIASLNKKLIALKEIAEKVSEEKSRFLAMMSHEIRNPLNAMLGYSEMIASETTNETIKNHSKYLSIAGNSLKVIVEDILDIARIEAGKIALMNEPFKIQLLVDSCAKDFAMLAQKQVDFNVELYADIPDNLNGDPVRLKQILTNLIHNAYKFTDEGTIQLKVKLVKLINSKKCQILFEVTDTGRGMTLDQTKKIFNEYEQNKEEDHQIFGGVGLGLSIVKRLTEIMGGKISVESKLSKGSTFAVSIPFEISQKASIKTTAISDKEILKGKKVLIADDDILNQTIVSHILSKQKATYTLVKDGLEALHHIEDTPFDLILLDINMPNMTGEQIVTNTTSLQLKNKSTPIIAITANATKETVKHYRSIGFYAVISKPYTSKEFLKIIGEVLSL